MFSLDLFWKGGGIQREREPAHQEMILYLPSGILVQAWADSDWQDEEIL